MVGPTETLIIRTLLRRVVVQILPQPALDFANAHIFALAVIGNLVPLNLAEAEVARFRMSEIKAAYA